MAAPHIILPEELIIRLEEAGRTLISLRQKSPYPRLASLSFDFASENVGLYAQHSTAWAFPSPSAAAISRMDDIFSKIALIPESRFVLRRIVGARSLVHPLTERHLYSWRRLGLALKTDPKAVKHWHAEGIALICAALNRPAGVLPDFPDLPSGKKQKK